MKVPKILKQDKMKWLKGNRTDPDKKEKKMDLLCYEKTV